MTTVFDSSGTRLPTKLEFFAHLDVDGYFLQKSGGTIRIRYYLKVYNSALLRSDAHDVKETTISEMDFEALWDKIKQLDIDRYQHISEKDMEPIFAQPGDSVAQFLYMKLNSKKVIDRHFFFPGIQMTLSTELARPLEEINSMLALIFRNSNST